MSNTAFVKKITYKNQATTCSNCQQHVVLGSVRYNDTYNYEQQCVLCNGFWLSGQITSITFKDMN